MNEPWRAIDGSEETHSRVFKPDRQPKAEWLHGPDGVPHAQRKKTAMKAGLEIKLDKWAEEVREGVEKIIETGRVPSMAQADLRACAQLLSAPAAPFQWSTDIYVKQRGIRPLMQTVEVQDEMADIQDITEIDVDSAPVFIMNELYLIRLDHPPFWGFARFFF